MNDKKLSVNLNLTLILFLIIIDIILKSTSSIFNDIHKRKYFS